MISRGLFSLLSAEPTIAAAAPGGVYPLLLPKGGVTPAMTYQVVGGTSAATLTSSGLQKVRVQFDCFAQSYDAAAFLRDTLIRFLNRYAGTLSDGTQLQDVQLIQSADFYDQDALQPRCMCEFYLFFNFTQ